MQKVYSNHFSNTLSQTRGWFLCFSLDPDASHQMIMGNCKNVIQKRHSKVTKLHNKIQELEENEYQSSFLSHKPLALSSPSSSLNECYSDSRNNSSSATPEAPRASLPSTAALRIKLQYLSNLIIPAT